MKKLYNLPRSVCLALPIIPASLSIFWIHLIFKRNYHKQSVLNFLLYENDWIKTFVDILLLIIAIFILIMSVFVFIQTMFRLKDGDLDIPFVYTLSFSWVFFPLLLVFIKFDEQFFSVLGIPIAIGLYFFNILKKFLHHQKFIGKKLEEFSDDVNKNKTSQTIHKKRYRNKYRKRNKLNIRKRH